MKPLTEKEKRATNFIGEMVYTNKGKEIARVPMADQEQVRYTSKRGADVSFRGATRIEKWKEKKPLICDKCKKEVTRIRGKIGESYCDDCY